MPHSLEYVNPPKYKDYEKRHSLKFDGECISESEFTEISNKNCFYCGVEGPNGIDRIDSDLGYIKSNCRSSCKHCNYVKGDLKIEDFKTWVRRFVVFQKDTNWYNT